MRKFAQTLFRALGPAFINQLKLKSANLNTQKVLLGTGLTAYGMWFASNRIFNSETQVFETEDNLQEGEVREIKVGPKD
jgi:hypothetical protein